MSDIETVERVARAICEAETMNPDDALGGWVHWIDAAKAAIDAVGGDLGFKIDKLGLGPLDVLVVKSDQHLGREQVDHLRRVLEEDAKISNKIMVIGPGLDLAILTRTEIESRIVPTNEEDAA